MFSFRLMSFLAVQYAVQKSRTLNLKLTQLFAQPWNLCPASFSCTSEPFSFEAVAPRDSERKKKTITEATRRQPINNFNKSTWGMEHACEGNLGGGCSGAINCCIIRVIGGVIVQYPKHVECSL